MNLFELSTLLSPLGGAVGATVALYRTAPSASGWLWVAIPTGLVFGFGFYRCLLRLAIGKDDKNPNFSGWRAAAILGVALAAPYLTAALMFILVKTILGVVA